MQALLDPRVMQILLAALAAGNRLSVAARIAGLNPKTVEEWLRRGQGVDDRPSEPAYVRMYQEVERAMALAEFNAVEAIRRGMERDPRLAIWFLENRSPEWRRRREPPPSPASEPLEPQPQVIVVEREWLEEIGLQRVQALQESYETEADADDRLGFLIEDGGAP